MRVNRLTFTVASVGRATIAVAQVEVVEPGAAGGSIYQEPAYTQPVAPTPVPASPSSSSTNASTSGGELFYQLQLLQEEVMKLHGIVEEQGEQLRLLKQQRLDDYISLDRRIGGSGIAPAPSQQPAAGGIDASQTPAPPGPAPTPAAANSMPGYGDTTEQTTASAPVQGPAPIPAAGEEQSYQAAYDLVRTRQFGDATNAFNQFLSQYPGGAYAGNAHYWLGELYLLNGDSDSAKKHFEPLLQNYPDNRKVPDAMFKLGRIYHQEGNTARAKELLQRVINNYSGTDSSAPKLAQEYLQQNF